MCICCFHDIWQRISKFYMFFSGKIGCLDMVWIFIGPVIVTGFYHVVKSETCILCWLWFTEPTIINYISLKKIIFITKRRAKKAWSIKKRAWKGRLVPCFFNGNKKFSIYCNLFSKTALYINRTLNIKETGEGRRYEMEQMENLDVEIKEELEDI